MLICKNCGSGVNLEDTYCENCGVKLDMEKAKYTCALERSKNIIKRRNSIHLFCNIMLAILLTLGITLTILSFFLTNYYQIVVIALALFVYVMFFITIIVRHAHIKRLEK